MSKALQIAVREFLSTVLTKGFLLGIIMTPLIIFIAAVGIAVLMKNTGPKVQGTVAVIDRSGLVAARVAERFSTESLDKEAREIAEKAEKVSESITGQLPVPAQQRSMTRSMVAGAAQAALEKTRGIGVEILPPDTDIARLKEDLRSVDVHARSKNAAAEKPRVMVVVIPEAAVRAPQPAPDAAQSPDATPPPYAKYEVFTAPKLDFEIAGFVQSKVAGAIIDARIDAHDKLRQTGLSAKAIRGILDSPQAEVISVTTSGGEKSGKLAQVQQMLIPMAFMLLLFMAVMVSGQSLLTTTIEEKSSRVMEVLLSAVSPMQLMVGKIMGQMGVGLLILVLYAGMGVGGLIAMSLADLIDFSKIVYLLIFFMIAYFTIASMMAAIGSAVSELREAQTLMTPVMMFMIIPWILWMPISRAPNAPLAQILSFVPGTNPFVMVIRLCGSEPVPAWQIPVSIVIGAATAVFCAWAAAKIFRVGVLMYGKPPNFRTLIKWVRMA